MTPEFRAGERSIEVAIRCTECNAPCGADFEWNDGHGFFCFDCEVKDQGIATVIYPHVGQDEYLVVKVSYGYLAMVRYSANPSVGLLEAGTIGKTCESLQEAERYLFNMGLVLA